MTQPNQERRRTIVVDPIMQGRMVFRIAGFPAIAMAGIAAFTGVYCKSVMDEARMFDADMPDLMPLIWLVILFELFAAGILVYHALRLSHTVAGPAFRIQKSLERIRNGDVSFTVNLRKGDHLVNLRDELNLLLAWLREHPPQGVTVPPTAGTTAAAANASATTTTTTTAAAAHAPIHDHAPVSAGSADSDGS